MDTLKELDETVANYLPDPNNPIDVAGYHCCLLALKALKDGCYGVGAVLLDGTADIIAEGRNEVFFQGFHSDRHAEMVAINLFEKKFPGYGDRGRLTLLISLEPCPMCLTRSLLAGIGKLLYLADDRDGGMVHNLKRMPAVWRNLAEFQSRSKANVPQELAGLAARLAEHRLAEKRLHLLQEIRPKNLNHR